MLIRLLAFSLALLLPMQSWAAPAFVKKVENTADAATTVAFAFTGNVTSGNLVTCEVSRYVFNVNDPFIAGDLTKTAGTSTIGTIAFDASASNTSGTDQINVAIWSVPVTGTGTLTMTGTSGQGDYWWGNCSEWSGTNTTKETSNSGTGTSTAADSGNVTSAAGAVFVGVVGAVTSANEAITEDGAFLLLNEEEDGGTHNVGSSIYKIVGTGDTDSASWTITSHPWAAAVVVYAASGGGGPTCRGALLLMGVGGC